MTCYFERGHHPYLPRGSRDPSGLRQKLGAEDGTETGVGYRHQEIKL